MFCVPLNVIILFGTSVFRYLPTYTYSYPQLFYLTPRRPSTLYFFTQTVDDAALRALYYRGLVAGGGVSDVAEGTARTIKEAYAFFATARLARRALHMKAPPLWRCRILELNVPLTQTAAAIPLATSSPYNTLINYW